MIWQGCWFEKRQGIVFALCIALLSINWCSFYVLSSITGCWQVVCVSWSSLLSGQELVQVDLDGVDGAAQVVADMGTHVVSVQTQHWCAGLVDQGTCLLAQATVQIRQDGLFKDISMTKKKCGYLTQYLVKLLAVQPKWSHSILTLAVENGFPWKWNNTGSSLTWQPWQRLGTRAWSAVPRCSLW